MCSRFVLFTVLMCGEITGLAVNAHADSIELRDAQEVASPIQIEGADTQAIPVAISTDDSGETKIELLSRGGLGYDSVIGINGRYGILFADKRHCTGDHWGFERDCDFSGVLVELSAGLGGAAVSFGYAVGRDGYILFLPKFWQADLKFTVIETYGSPHQSGGGYLQPGQTLVGVEGGLDALFFRVSLGIFKSVFGANGTEPGFIPRMGVSFGI